MSVHVGDEAGFIDTQGFELENSTDGLIYDQVLSIIPAELSHSLDFNQLTNDTVEKLFGLTDAAFEVTMLATQPELAGLLNLVIPVAAQLPNREWIVRMTDQSARITTLTGFAILNEFRIIDDGISLSKLKFKLEFVSEATVSVGSSTSGVISI